MSALDDLTQSLAKFRTAKRVSGNSASYKKDNPSEYNKVIAYLDGGTRPTGVTTDMGMALLLEEDARRSLVVVPPPLPDVPYANTVWDGIPGAVDPNSAAMIALWLTYAPISAGNGISRGAWGPSTAVSSPSDKAYAVYAKGRTTKLDTAIRIPAGTKVQATRPNGDGHLSVYDPVARRTHDFYQAVYDATADSWTADGGQSASTVGNGLIAGDYWGANAAGFPLRAGLITPEEIAAGRIPHALVFAHKYTGYGDPRFPAMQNHPTAPSTDSRYMPDGTWLQLNPSVNVDALAIKPWEKIVARALQEFGMFLRDSSGGMGMYGENCINRGGTSLWENVGMTSSYFTYPTFPWSQMRVLVPPVP